MNQCTTSLTGGIPDLCASSHLFSSAQPPIHLPYIQNNGLYCLAVAADLVLTSSTDVLHCCAIPAVLTHASALFAVHTAQFSFASEAVFFLSSTSKSMLLACHWTADGFCCILFSNPLPICSTKCAYIYVNLIFFFFSPLSEMFIRVLWFTTNLSGKIYFPQVWELIKLHYSSVVISVLFLFPSDESFPWKAFFVCSYIIWDDFGCVKISLCSSLDGAPFYWIPTFQNTSCISHCAGDLCILIVSFAVSTELFTHKFISPYFFRLNISLL